MQAPASMRGKDLGSPDEVRSFEKGRMDVVNLGDPPGVAGERRKDR
jgi:hypothetical protein